MSYGFLIIIFPLLIQTQTAADDSNPQYNCSSTSGNYTKNSIYERNLKILLANLNNSISLNRVTFSNTSYGRGADQVYGLALCHSNTFSFNCDDCVQSATDYITGLCPNKRAGIYWRDFCYVKYSNVDFFGDIDTDNKLTINMSPRNLSYSLTAITSGLLKNLSKNATANNHMFARGETVEPRRSFHIHGLVQCSGDLSKYKCINCLDYAIEQLPKYSTSLGVKAVTGRYDSYAFG